MTGRVAVVGAGANGASIGADLVAAGVDVTLVEQWPAHVEAMRSAGLRVRMADRELHVEPRVVHLCQVAELRDPFDVVLVVMKAYDTRWATQLLAPHLAEGAVVAAVQNGMTTDAVADVVGPDRAIGTVIEISSTMTEPGIVQRHTQPEASWFAVDADPRADGVAALLASSGCVERFADIESAKWMKLVSNCSLLVTTALLGMPMLDARDVPGLRELMIAASDEALAVGIARGHGILPIFGLTPADLEGSVAEALLDAVYGFVRPGATTTVLQDWGKSRRSEASELNGLVADEGARLGIPTPVNTRIVELARRVERGELSPGPHNTAALLGGR
ncbi:ketopantoate reductase family protein [Microbacterium ulmi]|uniref:2-dehydropantoate 2-reductase n=1 Tax=Microbacterium ulmi TaxID=179095 RepID=A0A7Y2M0R7_9MICO|nr:2-dehydropantoate 2-reductase [Microbacterium ulmi]NII68505.1 2-dehydropantoate 2-reductase [Microbacterium ulmi]NNH02973.1 2-dehydropantoate 2-reductase [Microbacterium ulmi]